MARPQWRGTVALLLSSQLLVCSSSPAAVKTAVRVVNMTAQGEVRDPLYVAVFGAAGLENRDEPSSVYVVRDDDPTSDGALSPRTPSRTAFWLQELVALKRQLVPTSALSLVQAAIAKHGAVLYDSASEPWSFTTALTLAGYYAAVPLDVQLLSAVQLTASLIRFNTTGRWATTEMAVRYGVETALASTNSLVINSVDDMRAGKLVDFIVHKKLFVLGSPRNATWCAVDSEDHRLLKEIVARSPWVQPVRVYGYNHETAGAIFEAETNCLPTLAALISGGTANVPFWSSFEPLSRGERMMQQPQQPAVYDSAKTYVSLLMSDMDNLDFVFGDGFRAMQQRAALCRSTDGVTAACPPLTWTMQPHLAELCPAILRWYYTKAADTGSDWFVLPPSGALYAYPGEFSPELQRKYSKGTNVAAGMLDTSASADWEFLGGWKRTVENYFPLFLNTSSSNPHKVPATTVKLFFLDQVPSELPISPAVLSESSVVLGDPSDLESVVLVQPPLSVASGGTWDHAQNPSQIAKQISNVKKGDVTYVYCITGNSAPQADLLNMTQMLQPHVEVVGYEQLASLARQRAAAMLR